MGINTIYGWKITIFFLRVIAKGYKVQNLPDVLVYARIDNGMHGRRKGLQYIKSEKQLLDLKNN